MPRTQGIQIFDQQPASGVLHYALRDAIAKFDDLNVNSVPTSATAFRKSYLHSIPTFEASRLATSQHAEIATYLAATIKRQLIFQDRNQNEQQLVDYFADNRHESLELQSITGRAEGPWQFEFVDENNRWTALSPLAEQLRANQVINEPALQALQWLDKNVLEQGQLDLSARKIVVIGAAAEMASTTLFLQAGAHVLWLDMAQPDDALQAGHNFSGQLTWPTSSADLLTDPGSIYATIASFADGDPVDLCLYAYAPGQARELRLTGVMNALIEALPEDIIGTITMLVSPTTASQLSAAEITDLEDRLRNRPGWEKIIGSLGLLGKPGLADFGERNITNTLVAIQGASYQAAQYLGKIITAEHWATHGISGTPLRVSANTAAITQTRSLNHPIFDAAFGGARSLQVETFTPKQSQTINGLLAVRDWLHPDKPVPGAVRVHGGIHTLPYPLNSALRIAALIGFVKSPRLIAGFLR